MPSQHERMRALAVSGLILSCCTALGAAASDTTNPDAVDVRTAQATVLVRMKLTEVEGQQTGTGFFINRNGLVLTNNHVVDLNHDKTIEERRSLLVAGTAPKYEIVINAGTPKEKVFQASLLHRSEPCDLAMLRVAGSETWNTPTSPFVPLSAQDAIALSTRVRVFGFPGKDKPGKQVVESQGRITRVARTSCGSIGYMEMDATIHPGNSGGPVVNSKGFLVGVAAFVRVQEGQSNRSGAVPISLVRQFILSAFDEKRVAGKKCDLIPFLDLLLDQNGIAEFPEHPRDAQATVAEWQDDTARRGKLITSQLTVPSPFGNIDMPLNQAAYLSVVGGTATLVMDGGDRLAFSAYDKTLKLEIDSRQEEIPLLSLTMVTFPRRTAVAQRLTGPGTVIEAEGCRLRLGNLAGQVLVGNARVNIREVTSISLDAAQQSVVQTLRGERVHGTLGDGPVSGMTAWAGKPIPLRFKDIPFVSMQGFDWSYLHAGGRQLVFRVNATDKRCREMANLLDSPKWEQAKPILEQARAANQRNSLDTRREIQLFDALFLLRSGKIADATEALKKLQPKDANDRVGWAAKCYLTVLQAYPDGKYLGESLAEPDAMWRASTATARQMTVEVIREVLRLLKEDENTRIREFKNLEPKLDVANRLETGIAQTVLIGVLWHSLVAHAHRATTMSTEYDKLVAEAQRIAPNARQPKIAKLKAMESLFKQTKREWTRLAERLQVECAGYAMDIPHVVTDKNASP